MSKQSYFYDLLRKVDWVNILQGAAKLSLISAPDYRQESARILRTAHARAKQEEIGVEAALKRIYAERSFGLYSAFAVYMALLIACLVFALLGKGLAATLCAPLGAGIHILVQRLANALNKETDSANS